MLIWKMLIWIFSDINIKIHMKKLYYKCKRNDLGIDKKTPSMLYCIVVITCISRDSDKI